MRQRVGRYGSIVLLALGLGGAGAWWLLDRPEPDPGMPAALPVPPFPPRIARGEAYEQCLAALAEDPEAAVAIADTLDAAEGAVHCRALALVALGRADEGAALLERLAATSAAPALARATVLGQAVQARLMARQADRAYDDASAALTLAPADITLLIDRATAAETMGRADAAIQDLTQALALDGSRADALVKRAAAWRHRDRLDQASADVDRALRLAPEDAEALLERGILRQRLGDLPGARRDWQRVVELDPTGAAADLAAQNLALLEAGPEQR